MKAVTALAVGACAFSTVAGAATWERFFHGAKADFFIDSSSVAQDGPGVRKAWVKAVYEEPRQEAEGKAEFGISLFALRCVERKLSQRQAVLYNAEGASVRSLKWPTDDWAEIAPESMGEALYDRVCRRPLPK